MTRDQMTNACDKTSRPFYININNLTFRVDSCKDLIISNTSEEVPQSPTQRRAYISPAQFFPSPQSNTSGQWLLRDITSTSTPYTLLPDPVSDCICVEEGHKYESVRFVGGHLLQVGSLVVDTTLTPCDVVGTSNSDTHKGNTTNTNTNSATQVASSSSSSSGRNDSQVNLCTPNATAFALFIWHHVNEKGRPKSECNIGDLRREWESLSAEEKAPYLLKSGTSLII
eukprot:Tbor_TRINITY_DN5536_c2_g4::TRINITY_DN5536_c2_g4_i1::g.12785::m.12785